MSISKIIDNFFQTLLNETDFFKDALFKKIIIYQRRIYPKIQNQINKIFMKVNNNI